MKVFTRPFTSARLGMHSTIKAAEDEEPSRSLERGQCPVPRLFPFAYRRHYTRTEFIESYSIKLGFCSAKIHSR